MPVGIYKRTEKHREALKVPRPGSGVYKRTKEARENISKAHIKQLFCDIEGCNNKHNCKGLCLKHYNEKNKERRFKTNEKWKQANKKERAEYAKEYRQKNKKHFRKYMRQWLKTPAGKISLAITHHNRRILEKDLTKAIIQRVYEDNIKQYGTLTCILCGKPVEFMDSSLDHSVPISRGGNNNYENLGIAHFGCNSRKYTMTLDEWRVSNPI